VVAKSKKKTDKADAAALARFLKLGWLPEVPVPSEQVRTLRQLLQARETLASMRTKLKNMAHAALSRNGVALQRSAFASGAGRARLASREDLPEADLLVLGTALRQIEQLDGEIRLIEEEVTRRGRTLKGLRRLLQVHGLNLLSAISLLAEVGDIALFDTSKQLVSYAGLATSTRQSSETTRHGGITKARAEEAAHCRHSSRPLDGQPHRHPADEFLPEEEAGEGCGQGHLRDGAQALNDYLCPAQERTRLLVLGRPLVQSQATCARCRGLSVDFA